MTAAKHRQPRTADQARPLLERFAELDGLRARIEAERNDAIANTAARAPATVV